MHFALESLQECVTVGNFMCCVLGVVLGFFISINTSPILTLKLKAIIDSNDI